MFGLFKKKKPDDNEDDPGFVYDQALILRIPLATEFGDEDIRNKILQFEADIQGDLPPKSGVDGHEFGDYEAVVYLYGPDADILYGDCDPTIRKWFVGDGASVTLQYGLPQDTDTKEKVIHV